jgi:hypothetical protein
MCIRAPTRGKRGIVSSRDEDERAENEATECAVRKPGGGGEVARALDPPKEGA